MTDLDALLEKLRQAEGYLSGQALSQGLGVSRTAVWKAMEKLRQEGYVLDSVPNRGYRLVRTPERIANREIRAWLGQGHPWGDKVICLDRVDSTNSYLKDLAARGAPHGTVVLAETQTAGRGRMGRSFFSPPGTSVYLSALLRPDCGSQQLMHLTCAVAEAMCDAVEAVAGLRPGIKWTNDLLWEGRKLAGILTELSVEAESGHVSYAVVGIGLNVSQRREDFPQELQDRAGSLAMATGQCLDRNRLAAGMIAALAEMGEGLLSRKEAVLAAYRRDCVTLHRQVSLVRGDTVLQGTALDVDQEGALVVRFSDGTVQAVSSGEVSLAVARGRR